MRWPLSLTWLARHGLIRAYLRRAAAKGDPHARLTLDPAVRADPFPHYRKLHERGPVVRASATLVAVGHAAASGVLRGDDFAVGFDHEGVPPALRRVATAAGGAARGPIDPPSLLAVNPPSHTRYRRLVAGVFTARAIAALEGEVRRTARAALDELPPGGGPADLVAGYARPVPLRVICGLLDVPAETGDDLVRWVDGSARSLDIGLPYRDFRRSDRANAAFNAWMAEHVARRRAAPGDDLVSRLVLARDEHGVLSDEEIGAIVGLVLAAGFETTITLIAAGARLLAEHPAELARLRREPELWGNAVEEVLRLESPVQETTRCALRDSAVGGRRVRRGTFVGVVIGAANRDPEVFADPDRFDVGREEARRHLAFSAGVHHCLGAALARLEGRIALEELFARYSGVELAGPPAFRGTRTLRSYTRLPVRLAAAPAAAPPLGASAGRAAPA